MRKALITMTTTAALALAGSAIPTRAHAHWVWPVIAGVAGGIIIGAVAARASGSPFRAYQAKGPDCFTQRERVRGGTRLVQYCY